MMTIETAPVRPMLRVGVLLAVALVALSSGLLLPIERLVTGTGLAPLALRALAMVQPFVLTAAAIVAGAWLGPTLGLGTPVLDAALARRPTGPLLRRIAGPALIVALAVAATLGLYARATAGMIPAAADFPMPLATRLLYGGVIEELLARFGIMTALAWLVWRLAGRSERALVPAIWTGLLAAALLFAAGHLPLLFLLTKNAPAAGLVAAVLAGNALPGALFGWLYWHRGLEAAMLAHGALI